VVEIGNFRDVRTVTHAYDFIITHYCISKAIFDCAWVVVNLINLFVARVLKNQPIVDVVLNLLK